ncbi:MAG: quinone-dependent dihydroorotate dehydrogenase [Anaerolineales bacterium]|jgi:dihydroorotate dehydrogenase
MYQALRPYLFKYDAERMHELTILLMRLVGRIPLLSTTLQKRHSAHSRLSCELFGLNFNNPVGLAAGYDKDGVAWRGLACLGFGHIEIGTVTLNPQVGNPRPRIFRLPGNHGIINRMGFPGKGAEFVADQLRGKRLSGVVLGVNIGKNQTTPLESAAEDYSSLLKIFAPLADYLVVNVSSPNTVGLRRLQARDLLETLLNGLNQDRKQQVNRIGRNLPLLVKLSPDLTDQALDDALDVILSTGMDGVIVSNTTVARNCLHGPHSHEQGGLSGDPLRESSTRMIRKVYSRTSGSLPIIGVGGIMKPSDALDKFDAGAKLVQLYTGLIYAGPSLVKDILESLQAEI